MGRFISGLVLTSVHVLSRLFFSVRCTWVSRHSQDPWIEIRQRHLRVICFLNHTSLFEPLFLACVPLRFIWFMAGRILVPGADKTLNRPLVGRFFKLLTPRMVPITRKRDESWTQFLSHISPEVIVALAPEGRMKRRNGLDSQGQPMSVRGGIGEILEGMHDGVMLVCYSGGLHHIQAPGDRLPRLFRRADIAFEMVPIADYKAQFSPGEGFKTAVARDLEARLKRHTP